MQYYFPGNVLLGLRLQQFKKMKTYRDEVELQSSKLNLGLRRTAMIDCDRYRLQQGRFRKVQSGFQSFLVKSCIQFQISFSR